MRIKLRWIGFIKFIVTTELYVDVGTGDCVCLIDYNVAPWSVWHYSTRALGITTIWYREYRGEGRISHLNSVHYLSSMKVSRYNNRI